MGLPRDPGTLMDAVLRAAGLNNASDGSRVEPRDTAAPSARLLVVPTAPAIRPLPLRSWIIRRSPACPAAHNPAGADHLRRPIQRRGRGAAGAMIRWLALLLAVLAAISLFIGDATLALPDGLILWQLRVPRTLLGMLVGGGLGLSGAVLQGALRNPLADPGLLGITGTAGLGAVIAFYWGFAAHFAPALPAGGLLGRHRRRLPAGLCRPRALRAVADPGGRRGVGDRVGAAGTGAGSGP